MIYFHQLKFNMYRFFRLSFNYQPSSITGRLFLDPFLPRCVNNSSIRSCDDMLPRRAIMYVPGHDQRKIEKIRTVNVDCAVLDCEDGVANNMKSQARHIISEIDENFDFGTSEYAVRINSIDSDLADDDLRAILNSKRIPQTIMVPKVENINHIIWINEKFKMYFKKKISTDKINLLIFVESAKGLLDLRQICEKASDLSQHGLFNFEGLVFGADDFCADIGSSRSADAKELLTARQILVITAKCFKIQAIDMVHIDYKDLSGLSKSAKEGAGFGFTGKQVIHPVQVQIVQKAFSPSIEKIQWAKEVIKQFKIHQDAGKGAFTFQGLMIDRPLLLQAQNIIKMAERMSD